MRWLSAKSLLMARMPSFSRCASADGATLYPRFCSALASSNDAGCRPSPAESSSRASPMSKTNAAARTSSSSALTTRMRVSRRRRSSSKSRLVCLALPIASTRTLLEPSCWPLDPTAVAAVPPARTPKVAKLVCRAKCRGPKRLSAGASALRSSCTVRLGARDAARAVATCCADGACVACTATARLPAAPAGPRVPEPAAPTERPHSNAMMRLDIARPPTVSSAPRSRAPRKISPPPDDVGRWWAR